MYMDEVLAFLKKTVPLLDENATRAKMDEIGVEMLDDLRSINFEEDVPGLFRLVQSRKVDKALQAHFLPVPSCAQPSTPRIGSQNMTPPPPEPQQSSSRGASIRSPLGLQNFTIPYERFDETTRQKLTKGEKPTNAEINEVVRVLCGYIWARCSHPGKAFVTRVAVELASTYPFAFRDQFEDGSLIGLGYLGINRKLIAKLAHFNRGDNKIDEMPNAKRRKTVSKKDKYGCVNFLPDVMPEGETVASLHEKKIWLQEEFVRIKADRNENKIKENMALTYIMQRQIIAEKTTVDAIRKEWPFLFEKDCLLQHFNALMGFDLMARANEEMKTTIPTLIRYFSTKVGVVIQKREAAPITLLREDLIKINEEERTPENKFVRVVLMLMAYWKQDMESLVTTVEDTASMDDIESRLNAPSHPHLAVIGDDILKDDCRASMVVENNAMEEREPIYESILLTFALYYVFSMQYPPKLAAILEYIQRSILKIDGDGTKVARIKAPPPQFNDRVLTLMKEVAEYKRLWKINSPSSQ